MTQINLFAGMGSHQSARSKTTTWLTPIALVRKLGRFDLDPCGYPGWPTADNLIVRPSNGLRAAWYGRVWVNPPYGAKETPPWLCKLVEHGIGTALIFARTETKMFFDYVWDHASAVLFLKGRINFHLPDGRKSERNAGAPSVLVAYGDLDVDHLAKADLAGKFVLLSNDHYAVVAVPRTWRELVRSCFNGDAVRSLDQLYEALHDTPKAMANQHWKAKIRQIVQSAEFDRLRPGVYRLKERE